MKRFGIITALALTGCATLAWAANNFGNTTITGTLTVVGSIIADGLSGLESLSLRNNDGGATLSMRSEMPEPEGEGDPIEAYSGIYPTGYGEAVEGEGDDDWAAASSNRPLFEVKPKYWDGDSLEDGPLFAIENGSIFLGMTDFSGAVIVEPGAMSIAGDVTANDSVTAESLSTTDGGLTMADADGFVAVNVDAYTGGAGTTLRKVYEVTPELEGLGGPLTLSYFQQNDGIGGVDLSRWSFGSTGTLDVEDDGSGAIVKIGTTEITQATIGEVDVTTDATIAGTTAVELLTIGFDDTGDGYASIDPQGFIDSTAAVRAASVQRTESATITAASSITPDCAANDVFDVTADQNITINAPTNFTDAQEIIIRWKQNGTGGYTPTWNSAFRFGSFSGTPTSTANATTIFRFLRNDAASKWDCIGVTTGLS